ncbi:MAG TPA: hypothetical protein VNM22_09820 [Candidatus Limnocylindrales bacterium]|nr:hypothetical protein [Candidatus Limnocylindrales bacterium]
MKREEKEKTGEQSSDKKSTPPVEPVQGKYGPVEEYHFSGIRVYHGIVNKWLLIVYLVLVIWALFYLFKHWGGLGPGLGF